MDRSTRIAFFSEHASPTALLGGVDAGGQNVYVDELSRNLANQGYLVDVFTRRDSPDTPDVIEWGPGVRVVFLPAGPAESLPKDAIWPFMPTFRDAFLRFMQLDEAQYCLIHGNFWMSGWAAIEAQKRLGIPAVQIFHALGKTKRLHQREVDTSPPDRISIEHRVIREARRLIAQCPGEQHELIHDYGADPQKVALIPSAVNTHLFSPVERDEARQRLGLGLDEKVIVYVGRILPRKDIRNIVRALALLARRPESISGKQPVSLLVVGGETREPDPVATPEIGELQKLAMELGVADRVHFLGKHQPGELRYFYSASDAVVTTPWYEPFGLTPLEAMACGRPVIGSAVGGITYTIKDGETGYLVPPRIPQILAERLIHLFNNPSLSRRLGCEARKRVEREFTWPIVAMRTAALYESILAQEEGEAWTIDTFSSEKSLPMKEL